MSLMSWVRDPVGQVKDYANLTGICMQDSSRFDDCDQVWAVVGIVGGIVGVTVLAFIARHFLREYSAHAAYRRKKLAEMEVATKEVMDRHVWSGDKSLEAGLTQEQMIEKIRQAKAAQRTAANKAGGNSTLGADGG